MGKINDKIAKKILQPYMTKILKCAYSLRCLSYSMSFEQWCIKFHEHLKNMNESEDVENC